MMSLGAFDVEARIARFLFGICAVMILICSITEFRVNWRGVASLHGDAAAKLAELKANIS